MHQYFDAHDFRDLHVLEEILPEDGVPEELHFEYMPEEDELATAALSSTEFVEWLNWERHECEVAQMLLHTRGSRITAVRKTKVWLISSASCLPSTTPLPLRPHLPRSCPSASLLRF